MTATRRTLAHAVVALASLAFAAKPAQATETTPARPLVLAQGTAAGFSTALGGDARRRFAARSLPRAASAEVLWRQRAPSGAFGNVLVDAAGRVFVAGDGAVLQLDADGRPEFTARGAFGIAAAAALLVDGKRSVLTRDGQLLAWSAGGALELREVLTTPARSAPLTLLPLWDGGVLASIGPWVFHVDSRGDVVRYTKLEQDVLHTLVLGRRALLVDGRGDVFEWAAFAEPERRGTFGGTVAAVAPSSDDALVAVSATGALVQLTVGEAAPPVALATSGLTLLAVRERRTVVLRRDGHVLQLEAGDRTPSATALAISRAEDATAWLIAGDAVAALGTDRPLSLRDSEGERELTEVRCRQPSSLVSAGTERLVVACRDGSLWAIGPASGR